MENFLIPICIFLVAQLIGGIWWAATINTKMDFMIDSAKGFKEIPVIYSTKQEVQAALSIADKNLALALATSEKNIAAMWKQIDMLKKD